MPVRFEEHDNNQEDETDLVAQSSWHKSTPMMGLLVCQDRAACKEFPCLLHVTARGAVFCCAAAGRVSQAVARPLEA